MTLWTGFLWGFGFAGGVFLWLVAWAFVREWLPLATSRMDSQEECLEALRERNMIGDRQTVELVRISDAVEKMLEPEGGK